MSIYSEKYDVIVAGGGPSGVGAAVAAARNGAKVLLIEKYGFLGGMATAAAVPAFCPYTDGEKVIIKGIGLEVLEAMKKESNYDSPIKDKKELIKRMYDWIPIDTEALKRVLDNIVLDSGTNILFHTVATDVVSEDGNIKAIVVENKEGKNEIRCKYIIDCTGDADIVVKAGGEHEYGDEEGLVQAVTLCYRISNINMERLIEYFKTSGDTGNLTKAVERARLNNEFNFKEKHVAGFSIQNDGVAGLNFGHVYEVNPLKAEDMTRAEVESRRNIPAMIDFLRKYVPGLENAVLVSSGPMVGVRETRRIIGDYRLTARDYFDRVEYEDSIARYAYPIDVHPSKTRDVIYKDENDQYVTSRYKPGESYTIPYRTLLPKGLKNIIVAGRPISADRAMHGSFRVMPACFATGEAAGTAVAICSKEGIELRDIEIKKLQEQLKKQGAYLG
ncbi:FAD-dependent oxidoreductase [Clostridium sp. YIM B02505]|uniref:FAD-dependent oxidoreductase n=1 Tax=Clostridium yunnanense TaxID=2800325 RepID=A0ABS1EKI1_9CLOT|nr:FAD-dependent oxidoreductase [Clostridium yunnanense]MBK1809845.1 FAD-dependent oxidoreductase [Clostridium yunnanense]